MNLKTVKVWCGALGMTALVGCVCFASGFGKLDEAWSDEVDLATAKVYVSTNATCPEIEAAKMLLRAQRMVAGGTDATNLVPQVAAEWPTRGIVIGWQGSALVAPHAKALDLKPWKEMKNFGDRIVQAKKGDVYVLAGNSPEGAFYSVADLLYRNGARMIHSGGANDGYASGLYLEWMKTLKAPASYAYSPVVANRTGYRVEHHTIRKDADKIAANTFAVMNGGTPAGPLLGGHARNTTGCECIEPPVADFNKHPDWFPLVNGKRWHATTGWTWVINGCYMNQEFLAWVVDHCVDFFNRTGGYDMVSDICLTDSDGGQDCNCEGCLKMRKEHPGSEWYWMEHQKINKKINARVPGLRNYTFAYGHGKSYPKNAPQAVSHLDAIMYCPHQRCYVHPYSVKCPTNKAELDRCEEWLAAGIPIGDFDYCYDVFNPSMNMPNWNITWDVVRYHLALNGEKGVPSIYMESACGLAGGGCGPKSRASVYVVARANWDGATEPAETHLKDFVRCAYADPAKSAFAAGSPESLMLDWYHACAKAWEGQKSHMTATFNNPTGTSKAYFTQELIDLGAKAFAASEQAIKSRLAPAGTPFEKMTRTQYAAWKQYETWKYEKKYAYDEWNALRTKALNASLEINLEEGDPSDGEFDRQVPYTIKMDPLDLQSNEVPTASVKLYRTAKALRARFAVKAPAFKKMPTAKETVDKLDFSRDCVEIFVQAPGKSDYYHLAACPDGTRYDALCMNATVNSDKWRCETVQRDGFVEYTFTIDWDIFGAGYAPKAGETVKFLADVTAIVPKRANGRASTAGGLPRAAYHDLGVAADLLIDANTGRRAGGL